MAKKEALCLLAFEIQAGSLIAVELSGHTAKCTLHVVGLACDI